MVTRRESRECRGVFETDRAVLASLVAVVVAAVVVAAAVELLVVVVVVDDDVQNHDGSLGGH